MKYLRKYISSRENFEKKFNIFNKIINNIGRKSKIDLIKITIIIILIQNIT